MRGWLAASVTAVPVVALLSWAASEAPDDDATASSAVPVAAASASATAAEDDRFVAATHVGVVGVARDLVVMAGRRACGAFSEGSSAADVSAVLESKGFSAPDAQAILRAAVATYCPEYAGLVTPTASPSAS